MKVLFISRRFYPDVKGGGQISAFYIAKAVREQGHEVFVVTFNDEKKEKIETMAGFKVYRIPIPKLRFFPRLSNMEYMYIEMARLSSKVIETVKPDIIHLLNFESIPLSAVYYKLKFKLPIVATVNGPSFGCFTQNAIDYEGKTCINCRFIKRFLCSVDKWGLLKGALFYFYSFWYMFMIRFSYCFVDKFFAVSTGMVPLLENATVPRKKICVIHNPIERKDKVQTELKKELGIKNKKVLLYTGTLTPIKGIDHTIRALQHLGDNVIFLVVGGKNSYYYELDRLVKKLNVKKKIKFIGSVSPSKIIEYYSIADVFVLMTVMYDAFPRCLLEAGILGIPLVGSNRGGVPDVIDKNTGIILSNYKSKNIAKAITLILSDKKRYRKISLAIQKKIIGVCSMEVVGKKLINEYKKLL